MDQEKYSRKIELSKAASAQNAKNQIDSNNEHEQESKKIENKLRGLFPKQHAIADERNRDKKSDPPVVDPDSPPLAAAPGPAPADPLVHTLLSMGFTEPQTHAALRSCDGTGRSSAEDLVAWILEHASDEPPPRSSASPAAPITEEVDAAAKNSEEQRRIDLGWGDQEIHKHVRKKAAAEEKNEVAAAPAAESMIDRILEEDVEFQNFKRRLHSENSLRRMNSQGMMIRDEETVPDPPPNPRLHAKGGSHQDEDTAPDPPPNPRPPLAQVVGNWAGSVRRISGDRASRQNRGTVPNEEMIEILDADVVQVTSDPPNKRRAIYLGIALVVAVAVIGGAIWFTQPRASQTPTSTATKIDQLFCGDSILGDTTREKKNEVESCGNVGYKTNSPGKKYYFKGDGNFILMSTCHEYTKGATTNFYDSRIRVFRKNKETSEEECVVGNNDDAGCDMWNKASTVQFQSEPNMLYAVYVDGPRTTGGLFELDVTCVDAPSVGPSVGPSVAPTLSLLPYSKDDSLQATNIFNSYEYAFIETLMDFSDHQNAAAAWGGSIASIHSSEEYNYVKKTSFAINNYAHWYLGGKRKEGSDAYDGSADAWEWLDGSPWDFTKWDTTYGGEPNNFQGKIEDVIVCCGSLDWQDYPSSNLQKAVYKKIIKMQQ